MLPQTPRGFRDILPDEAAWRASIDEDVQKCFSSWGYMPIETPALEVLETMKAGGGISNPPIAFFDSDGRVLAMRPDVTLPVARMVATRLKGQEPPFRFRYRASVFREEEKLRAQQREMTQLGIESIGLTGVYADAEVISLFVAALAATGLQDYMVAICTVGVLRGIIDGAGMGAKWEQEVLSAYHESNFVVLEELADADGVKEGFGAALKELHGLRGGRAAIERCEEMMESLGCSDAVESLLCTWDILQAAGFTEHIMVDFSIMTSFDYYTGLVIEAYAPGFGMPLGSGGRYDGMLAAYGRDLPAAGFAFSLERVMSALVEQGAKTPRRLPDILIGGSNMQDVFVEAASIRASGKQVCITGQRDVEEEAKRRGIKDWYFIGGDRGVERKGE